jgi:transposase
MSAHSEGVIVKQKRGTPAEKAKARKMVLEEGKSIREVAQIMGRNRATITEWIGRKAKRITPEEIADIRRMVNKGISFRQIQKEHKYSLYTISRYTRNIEKSYSRICPNPECRKTFETTNLKQMYCSRRCNSRHKYLKSLKK